MAKKKKKGGKKDPFYKGVKVHGKGGYDTTTDTGWGSGGRALGGSDNNGGDGSDYHRAPITKKVKAGEKKAAPVAQKPAPKKK